MVAPSHPNLFVIGSMKSGTTFLHDLLSEHPDIFMCAPKEPAYFADNHRLFLGGNEKEMAPFGSSKRRDLYLSLFRDGAEAKIRGDSSTVYTKRPQVRGVAERIFASIADARLIYVMRDPPLRTISHYWHNVHIGEEHRDLLDAVRTDARYLDYSRYAMQLAPYLEVFPRDRIRLITFEALIHHTPDTLKDVFAWLGVDDVFQPQGVDKKSNATPAVVRRPSGLGVAVRRINRRTFGSGFVDYCARRLLSRRCERGRQDTVAASRHLRTELQSEIDQLEIMFDRTFPEWNQAADPGLEPRGDRDR